MDADVSLSQKTRRMSEISCLQRAFPTDRIGRRSGTPTVGFPLCDTLVLETLVSGKTLLQLSTLRQEAKPSPQLQLQLV